MGCMVPLRCRGMRAEVLPQGFHSEDFQRRAGRGPGRGDVHPDIMPPGPGRFDDSMFG